VRANSIVYTEKKRPDAKLTPRHQGLSYRNIRHRDGLHHIGQQEVANLLPALRRPQNSMPDPVQLSAFDKLLDYGVLGIALAFSIGAIMWLMKKLLEAQEHVIKAKEAHKDDAVKFAVASESLKNTLQSQTELLKITLETFRDRGRE
jgi:hypothetical protein